MRLFTCLVISWTILGQIGCSSFEGHAVYHGCFSVLGLQRHFGHILNPFVAEDCLKLCSGNGHNHAGIESVRDMCYCGDNILSLISKAEDSLCKPCINDTNLYCGGVLKLSLYEIAVNSATEISTIAEYDIESEFKEDPLILLAGPGGIYLYNISADYLKTVIHVDYPVDSIDYDLRKGLGFGIWGEIIYRFPLFEEDDYEKHVGYVDRCPTMTVDWVHGFIYWPDCYSHQIKSIDINLELEEEIIVKPPEGAWALDMAVDPYKGLLFWSTGATLWACRLDGRGLRKVVPEFPVNKVASLSMDLAAARVYFSGVDKHDKNTSKLYYTSYDGSLSHSLQYHEYEGGSHISNFGIFNDYVYFLKGIDTNSTTLVASKLEYSHRPTHFLQGKHVQLIRLRLVHPRLQSPAKVDACTTRGCSHLCLMEASHPHCYCPRFYDLDNDNKTCIILNPSEAAETPLLLQIAAGLMLVLIVLLGAGVLMCLCDKIWSQLHPTVIALSVPGAAKRTFTGHRRQDGENLI